MADLTAWSILYIILGVMSVPAPSVPGPSSQILDWVRVMDRVRVRVRVAVQELTAQELSGSHHFDGLYGRVIEFGVRG